MTYKISEETLIEHLKKGVRRTTDLVATVTDYHGGPTTTEYLVTSDIAREFIEANYETQVEFLNRRVVNGITALVPRPNKIKLGSKRTDVALIHTPLIPLALIEVKIGVVSLNGIKVDLDKITDTFACLNATHASKVLGAVVFQMSVAATKKRITTSDLKTAIKEKQRAIKIQLLAYLKTKPGFTFRLVALQGPNDGISASDKGNDGHATRFYAVLIRDKRPPPLATRTIRELKDIKRR